MIPELNLASNPAKRIQMREATVEEAIEFAEISPAMEEAAITAFLNRVQLHPTFYDSRLWSGDDRRLMLLWYALHTVGDTQIPLTYQCEGCGKAHTVLVDLRDVSGSYRPIAGKSEREADFNGEKVIIRPLTGENLEEIEIVRVSASDKNKEKTLSAIRALEVVLASDFVNDKDETPEKRRRIRERRIRAMTVSQFNQLRAIVEKAWYDMQHGLESVMENGVIYLLSPEIKCSEGDAKTRLRFPFRAGDFIPAI